MKNSRSKISLLITVGLLVLAAAGARAQDWPQWRGANRDAKVTASTVPKAWPRSLTQKWKVTVGQSDATPAVVGDTLYVFSREGDAETLRCLNVTDGSEIWMQKYHTDPITAPLPRHIGPRSTPAVAEFKVVTLGITGILCFWEPDRPKIDFRRDAPESVSGDYPGLSPLIADGLCFAYRPEEDSGTLAAYDLKTFAEKWKLIPSTYAYVSPVTMTVDGTKLLAVQTDKSMLGVNATNGRVLWSITFPSHAGYDAATPIIDGSNVIYSGAGRVLSAAKIEKSGDHFSARDLWTNQSLSPQHNTPVLKNGLIFGLSEKGNFACVNAADGKTLWTDTVGGRGAYGSIVDAGAVLFALTPAGQLIVFEASDKKYTELASIKVADKPVYAYPVVSGNRVFIQDQDSVALWVIE